MKKQYIVLAITTALLISACAQEQIVKEHNQQAKALNKVEQKDASKPLKETLTPQPILADERQMNLSQLSNKSRHQKMKRGQHPSAYQESMIVAPMSIQPPNATLAIDNEKYRRQIENSIKQVALSPVSTFSIDVDTASYSNVRRLLNQGHLPQKDAIRVEELVNYFSYNYPAAPVNNEAAFSVYSEIAPSPYNADKHLLHLGIQGKKIVDDERPPSNLVFLIDVSGSMNRANKLGLLKNSLKMLTKQLGEHDSVAIVVYAGSAGTVLKPTAGNDNQAIVDALSRLTAGGSTNGGAGINAAYALAKQSFIDGGINRVILATDGDFNVGTTNQQVLKELIVKQRESGIALSILGLGAGNYNDALMQELAQNGNGNAYYIDTLNEARKVLVEELSSTLMIIAKDVKIQLEFNPDIVSEYRLIGYETRQLKRQDFNNDKVDAGDIGAGHSVTALYEIALVDSANKAFDPLRYSKKRQSSDVVSDELAYLRLRYKKPEEAQSQLIEQPIQVSQVMSSIADASNNFKFSAAVAGFGQFLKNSDNVSTLTNDRIIALAQQGRGEDQHGYRSEFINMVKLAQALSPTQKARETQIVKH